MEWNFPIWFGSGIWFYAGFLGLLLAGEPGIPTSSAVTTHTQNPPNNANKLFFSAQFHTSGRLVSSRKHGNSPSLASLQNRNSVGTFDLGACRKSGSYPMPDGRWLVITKQRSGSRWLVDTMTERTGGLVPYTREITCGGCYCGEAGFLVSGSEENHCTCKLAQFYKDAERATTLGDSPGAIRYSGADGPTSARRHHYGFKFMSPTGVLHTIPGAFDVLARSVCNLNIPVIFMWRRNILRRLVSAKSNKLTRKEGVHQAHPTTSRDADALREFKPEMRASGLVRLIETELATQHNIEQSFANLSKSCQAARNARVFYYEDLLDGAEGSEGRWGQLLGALRIWDALSGLTIIHGDQPVGDTISNPEDVAEALRGTQHEWMLQQ